MRDKIIEMLRDLVRSYPQDRTTFGRLIREIAREIARVQCPCPRLLRADKEEAGSPLWPGNR